MAYPDLDPISTVSTVILPSRGTYSNVVPALPLGVYSGSYPFISGAVDQVSFVYNRLGGNVLDIELKEQQVYAAYEEAVLEYSYITNLYQGKSTLSSFLGGSTASFDEDGNITNGPSGLNLKYPKFKLSYAKNVGETFAEAAGVGGSTPWYSASIDLINNVQEYDIQSIISSNPLFTGSVGNKRIDIRRVYYKSARAAWRFYGYYGGYNVIGNLSTYGMFADDSCFEVIPPWHNKLQAMAYEESINMRLSHMSYEIHNNKLKLFPIPKSGLTKLWINFSVADDAWTVNGTDSNDPTINGINNLNTLPFDNLPYEKINSMGKQWIRQYALAICKEMLGQIRGKLKSIPIPGNDITLNYDSLLSEAKEEKAKLREDLFKILDEITYAKLAEQDAGIAENVQKTLEKVPLVIYLG